MFKVFLFLTLNVFRFSIVFIVNFEQINVNFQINLFYILCHWFPSISPENIRKLEVVLFFLVDTGRKLNVHKTFKRRPGRLLNVLCTFNLHPVSTGLCFQRV